ncbi:hypothetical protein BDQ12DRAFT_684078, partial [Crucibulum laeve]
MCAVQYYASLFHPVPILLRPSKDLSPLLSLFPSTNHLLSRLELPILSSLISYKRGFAYILLHAPAIPLLPSRILFCLFGSFVFLRSNRNHYFVSFGFIDCGVRLS